MLLWFDVFLLRACTCRILASPGELLWPGKPVICPCARSQLTSGDLAWSRGQRDASTARHNDIYLQRTQPNQSWHLPSGNTNMLHRGAAIFVGELSLDWVKIYVSFITRSISLGHSCNRYGVESHTNRPHGTLLTFTSLCRIDLQHRSASTISYLPDQSIVILIPFSPCEWEWWTLTEWLMQYSWHRHFRYMNYWNINNFVEYVLMGCDLFLNLWYADSCYTVSIIILSLIPRLFDL